MVAIRERETRHPGRSSQYTQRERSFAKATANKCLGLAMLLACLAFQIRRSVRQRCSGRLLGKGEGTGRERYQLWLLASTSPGATLTGIGTCSRRSKQSRRTSPCRSRQAPSEECGHANLGNPFQGSCDAVCAFLPAISSANFSIPCREWHLCLGRLQSGLYTKLDDRPLYHLSQLYAVALLPLLLAGILQKP